MPLITATQFNIPPIPLFSNEQDSLTASDAAPGDWFGYEVSLSSDGNTLLTGAHGEDTPGSYSGAAYVFTRSGETWSEQQKIESSDIADNDGFGNFHSISADGNTAIISSRTDNSNTGAAYVFTRSGSTWTEKQKLVGSDIVPSDQFGTSVAISGDGNTIIISAYLKEAAYVFTRGSGSPEVWKETQILTANLPGNDYFGYQISISTDGNTALITAQHEDDIEGDSGAAHIFTRSSGSPEVWIEKQRIKASDAGASDLFGESGAISGDGNTLVIGSYLDDDKGGQAGAAYIFTRGAGSPEVWTEKQKLTGSDTVGGDQFGIKVDISNDGTKIIVGAHHEDLPGNSSGAAYIFTRGTGSPEVWTEDNKIEASDAADEDRFGKSVAISGDGNTTAVGAWNKSGASGAVYIYT